MKRVPNSNHVSETLCNKFSTTLLIDAKYISVRGHDKKMAFIWAIDYYSHDIVWWELSSSENIEIYLKIFSHIKKIGYELKFLVSDDHIAIRQACTMMFPKVHIQVCLAHLKRNIQKVLDLRFNEDDRRFFKDINLLFKSADLGYFQHLGKKLFMKYLETKYRNILMNIDKNLDVYTTYLRFKTCPSTSNLIEGYNKHLNGRLSTIDGFKTYTNAELWLNAYVIYRRLKEFRHCKGKFKYLNGKFSLQFTLKEDIPNVKLLKF